MFNSGLIIKKRFFLYSNIFEDENEQTQSFFLDLLTMPKVTSFVADCLMLIPLGFLFDWYLMAYLISQWIVPIFFDVLVFPLYPELDVPFIDWGEYFKSNTKVDAYLG
jgi:hypothetical protein